MTEGSWMSLSKNDDIQLADTIIKHKIKYAIETINNKETIILEILNHDDLSVIMSKVNELNRKKESIQQIIVSTEAYQYTDIVIKLIGNEFKNISKSQSLNCVEVGSDVQISELAPKLYHDFNLSLAIPNFLSCVKAESLIKFPEFIKALTVCTPEGNIMRFDETQISDIPLASIVLSIELKCTEAHNIKCKLDVISVNEFLNQIKNGLFNKPNVSVMYVPTYLANELTSQEYKSVAIYHQEAVLKNTEHDVNLSNDGAEERINTLSKMNELLEHYPHLIPYFNRYLISILHNQTHDAEYPSYRMYKGRSKIFHKEESNYLFRVNSNDDIVFAFENIVRLIDKYSHDNIYPISDAIYLSYFNGMCEISMVTAHDILGYSTFKKEIDDFFISSRLRANAITHIFTTADDDYLPKDRSAKIAREMSGMIDNTNNEGKILAGFLNKITPASVKPYGLFYPANNFELAMAEPERICEDWCRMS